MSVGTVLAVAAETALRLKNQRIADLIESEAALTQQLAATKGAADAQQGQIRDLESKLYRAESDNREMRARLETTERQERAARERIGVLEETVEDLKRKLALGGGTY